MAAKSFYRSHAIDCEYLAYFLSNKLFYFFQKMTSIACNPKNGIEPKFRHFQGCLNVLSYSKALRCTCFGEWKYSCSLNFEQLKLLNKAKAKTWNFMGVSRNILLKSIKSLQTIIIVSVRRIQMLNTHPNIHTYHQTWGKCTNHERWTCRRLQTYIASPVAF